MLYLVYNYNIQVHTCRVVINPNMPTLTYMIQMYDVKGGISLEHIWVRQRYGSVSLRYHRDTGVPSLYVGHFLALRIFVVSVRKCFYLL